MTFGDQWANTTVNDNEQSEPPEPGTYEVTLTDARAFTSKKEEDWFMVEFRILAGAGQGHTWSVLANLGKEGGVKAAKSMSGKLGVPIDQVHSLADLDRLVKGRVGSYFEVDVVQKDQWRNTFVRGALAAPTQPTDVPVPDAVGAGFAAVDDDSIPF